VPSAARSLLTVAVLGSPTQMLVPSKANPMGVFPEGGLVPARNVPKLAPSLARSLVTVPSRKFVTQMLTPSKSALWGPLPTEKVPSMAPSLARTLLTPFEPFITQMLSPSKAMGPAPLGIAKLVVRLAGYQCRVATCWGFLDELITPTWASAEPHSQARA